MFPQIRILLFCLLTLILVSSAGAEEYFHVTTLAPDLLLLSTDQGSYSNNSLVFTGDDGLLLVDTHHTADREEFKKFVEKLGYGPPKIIITTHRHVEHIGSNDAFGPDPIIVGHEKLPNKLRSGSFLFTEYPPEAFPDITFADSLVIHFNDEDIRLVNIGGSHDDNEILVHFPKHRIAHTSSVVNGFNFPSVDSDGDVLGFEKMVRHLMTLLPQDVGIVSGHHGQANGYDFVGKWSQLEDYADMMGNAVDIVRSGLNQGKTKEELQEAKVLSQYDHYGGSYVSATDWIDYLVEAMTVPRDERDDVFKPVFQVWKKSGAQEAVAFYKDLKETGAEQYSVDEYILMSIGSKLYTRGLYEDAGVFLVGGTELYPDSEFAYYTHYLAAKSFHKSDSRNNALKHAKASVQLNSEFESATTLLKELEDD